MSILGTIFSKLFPSAHAANDAPTGTASPGTAGAPTSIPAAPTPMQEVDVEQMLDGMATKSPEKLNWKTSIVDLMKLLGIDNSLSARKSLAQELHYSGALDGSAEMNIWLHRQVMNKVAANGGKVPVDLKD